MKRSFTQFAFAGLMLAAVSTQAQTIFQENFEGTSGTAIPAMWTQSSNATDGGWKSGIGLDLSSSSMPFPDHTRILATNDDGCGQTCDKSSDFLRTPSFSLTGVSNAFLSVDVLFYDGTYGGFNEDFIIKASTDGGFNWTTLQSVTGAGGWNTLFIDLSSLANQASVKLAFEYKDNTGWLFGAGIDNVTVYVPAAVDVVLTSIAPVAGDPAAYGTVGSNITFTATVFNQGSTAITSGIITYTADGGAPVTYILPAGTNIAPFTSADFTITPPYSIPSVGDHNIEITLAVLGDASTGNDMLSTTVVGAQFIPTHIVTFEEGTGTWCGWCPRGAVFMDSMRTVYGTTTALIAVHNSDPMTLTAYDAGIGTFVSGYPSVLVDRKVVIDPSEMFDPTLGYDKHINDFGFANLAATKTYNASTRALSVVATANFAVNLSGSYRLALVLTEDGVHSTANTDWDQHNYYSSQTNDIPLSGAGHNWQVESDPVPAADMSYDHVARYISGSFNGQSGSLPASITAGSTETYTFNTTLPAGWNDWNMHGIVLLIDVTSGKILNAVNVAGLVNSTEDLASQIDNLSLYPNPAEGTLNVSLSLTAQNDVTISITDVLGKVAAVYNYNNVAAGVNQVSLNTVALANGVYFANIKTNNGSISRKFVKQ